MLSKTLTKDDIGPLAKTAYPADLPDFHEDKVSSVILYSPWWGTIPLTVVDYDADDWADPAEPSSATEIMFSERDRQWKSSQWVLGSWGDILELVVRPYNEKAPEP